VDLWKLIDGFAKRGGLIIGACGTGFITKYTKINDGAPFVKSNARVSDPGAVLPGCKSIIAVGLGRRGKKNFECDNMPRGVFSSEAIGTDYHILLKNKLTELIDHLLEYVNFEYKFFIDTGPLSEKPLMIEAGLGWPGKNSLICSDEYGSFFNAGYILTDLDIECERKQKTPRCGDCRKCVDACPGGALGGDGFNYNRCASYLTQKKGALTDGEQKIIGVNLYGCDICREVCPFNAGVYTHEINDIEDVRPDLNKLLVMTKKEFDLKFKTNALYWRGLSVLKRNAYYAFKNIGDRA